MDRTAPWCGTVSSGASGTSIRAFGPIGMVHRELSAPGKAMPLKLRVPTCAHSTYSATTRMAMQSEQSDPADRAHEAAAAGRAR